MVRGATVGPAGSVGMVDRFVLFAIAAFFLGAMLLLGYAKALAPSVTEQEIPLSGGQVQLDEGRHTIYFLQDRAPLHSAVDRDDIPALRQVMAELVTVSADDDAEVSVRETNSSQVYSEGSLRFGNEVRIWPLLEFDAPTDGEYGIAVDFTAVLPPGRLSISAGTPPSETPATVALIASVAMVCLGVFALWLRSLIV